MYMHEELRRAREEAGLTQAELAQLAAIPRNQIVRAERGDNITIDTLRKIVAHLPISTLTLLENVQMTADLLPTSHKLYLGAMATLGNLTQALGSAVDLAMAARLALERDRAAEPLLAEAGVEDLSEDDVVLLKSLAAWYREIEASMLQAMKTG